MRGRRPVPAAIHHLRGTYRADRHGGSVMQPPCDLVGDQPPKWLSWMSEGAKAFWREMAPVLRPLGLLTNLDLSMFAVMCVQYDGWRQTSLELQKTGLTYKSGDLEKRHPLAQVMASYRDGFIKVALDFGMSPASRGKLQHIQPPPEPDEFEEFLRGGIDGDNDKSRFFADSSRRVWSRDRYTPRTPPPGEDPGDAEEAPPQEEGGLS